MMQSTEIRDSLLAASQHLGLAMTQEQAGQLERYALLLLKWNATYNLTSLRDLKSVLGLHLLDSLTLVPFIEKWAPQARRVLDVGSGGGLPAIPLAIMRPDLSVTMADAVKKKVMFLRQAGVTCGLKNVQALHVRVETLQDASYDVVTSRAFASLADMVTWTRGALSPEGTWIAMKGRWPQAELDALPDFARMLRSEQVCIPGEDAERHIIQITKNV